jgi:DNA-binding transcriptional ArsR family regulator
MPSADSAKDLALFAALADGTRAQILKSLAMRGRASATQLAADLPVTRQAIVKHLAVLDRAGLVARQMHGCEARYAVQSAPLRAAARQLETIASEWDRRLARLKTMAEASRPEKPRRGHVVRRSSADVR